MSGLSGAGFVRRTFSEIDSAVKARIRATPGLARINLEFDSFLGNVTAIANAGIAECWAVLQSVYDSWDPDNATGRSLENISALTGTYKREATETVVDTTVNVNPGVYAAGVLIAMMAGAPSLRFRNRDTITNAGVAAANIAAVFVCEETGPISVPSGSLVISSPYSGWNSITNAVDGIPGRNEETDAELRQRRVDELSQGGGSTFDAMRLDILADGGRTPSRVRQVRIFENDTDSTVGGLSPHSFEAVIWDGTDTGTSLSNADAASLVWSTKPCGIRSVGTTEVMVLGGDGFNHPVRFSRPENVNIYVNLNITTIPGYGDVQGAIRNAILQYARDNLSMGDDVVRERLKAACWVPGLYDITSFTLGTTPAPVGTVNIVMQDRQIAGFDSVRITFV